MHERCDVPCNELTRLESRMNEYEAQNNSLQRNFDERLRAVEMSDAVQREQFTTILSKIDDLTKSTEAKIDKLAEKAESMEAKPGKRWESVVMCVITTICTAVLVFLLSKIGL